MRARREIGITRGLTHGKTFCEWRIGITRERVIKSGALTIVELAGLRREGAALLKDPKGG